MNAVLSPRRFGAASMLFTEEFDLDQGAGMDFGVAGAPSEPEIIAPVFALADIEEAREAAWAEGREAGLAETTSTSAAEVRASLAAIANALGSAAGAAATFAEQAAEEIARTLLDTLATMLPALCARHGEDEVRAVVRAVLPPLLREPVVTVRLNPAVVGAVQDELGQLDPDLAQRVRLVPIAAMPAGDVRVSWEDGTAARDTRAAWDAVAAALADAGLLTDEAFSLRSKPCDNAHDIVHDSAKESARGG